MSYQRLTRNKHEGLERWHELLNYANRVEFETLLGRRIADIHVLSDHEQVLIVDYDDNGFLLCHTQDCCESVYLEDIEGDLEDLLDIPLVQAEEISSNDGEPWRAEGKEANHFKLEQAIGLLEPPPQRPDEESYTWTFYRLSTQAGGAVLRWYGSSNGYYGESVDVYQISPEDCRREFPWAFPPPDAEPDVETSASLLSSVSRSSHER